MARCLQMIVVLVVAMTDLSCNPSQRSRGTEPAPASKVASSFGDLPPDPLLALELSGVQAELGFMHLVAPSVMAGRLPRNTAPVTLRRLATVRGDTATTSFLAHHPEYGEYALGNLVFGLLDTFSVGTVNLAARQPAALAVWWVLLRRTDTLDARARGDAWLELAQWHAQHAAIEPLRAAGIAATPADITIERTSPTTWVAQLEFEDVRVIANCELTDAPRPIGDTLPGYSAIWQAGEEPRVFTLFTSYGHYMQPCRASWSAQGRHPLVQVLTSAPDAYPPSSERAGLQDRWRARGGVYRHK